MVEETPQGTRKAAVSKATKRLKKLHVQKTDNDGFVVTHHFRPQHGGTPKPERHAFGKYEDAHSHIESTMRGHK